MGYDGLIGVVKAEHVTDGSSDQKYQLGAKVYKDGNQYTYVYNGASASAILSGQYCVLQTSGGSLTSGYTVTVTNASLAGVMAGVAQNTIATGYYGFVMSRGVSVVIPDSGAVSAAAAVDLALGTDGGFVAAAATFSTAPRFGLTINTMVTAGTGKARIFNSVL